MKTFIFTFLVFCIPIFVTAEPIDTTTPCKVTLMRFELCDMNVPRPPGESCIKKIPVVIDNCDKPATTGQSAPMSQTAPDPVKQIENKVLTTPSQPPKLPVIEPAETISVQPVLSQKIEPVQKKRFYWFRLFPICFFCTISE